MCWNSTGNTGSERKICCKRSDNAGAVTSTTEKGSRDINLKRKRWTRRRANTSFDSDGYALTKIGRKKGSIIVD